MVIGMKINGSKIGKSKFDTYEWASCPDCGYERWVSSQSLKRTHGRCVPCANSLPVYKARQLAGMKRCKAIQSERVSQAMARPEVHKRFVEGCRLAQIERWSRVEEREKQSERMKGKQNALGHTLSNDLKQEFSERMKDSWGDASFAKMMWDARNSTPNQCELKLQSILQELNLPYEFVGDGKLIIGGKCPDFANVNGQKKIIELFGDYWHSEAITGHSIEKEEQERIDHFASLGFKTLIIWESELSNIDTLIQKILSFDRRCRNACTSKAQR